jgi:hypothetical protein
MKKKTSEQHQPADDQLRPEYDFSGVVRGKHYFPLHEGYTITIHKADGTTEVQQITCDPGIVRLEPDVQAVFPDSQTVNRALRSLIALMTQFPEIPKSKRTSRHPAPR